MTRTNFLAAAIVLFGISANAQTYRVLVKDKGWGYINLNGDMVIPVNKSGLFKSFTSDGLASVAANKKTVYFLDTMGHRIDPDKSYGFNTRLGFNPDDFNNGLIPFEHSGKWGFMNTKMAIAIEPAYDEVTSFSEGYAFVKPKKDWVIIDTKGKETELAVPDVSSVKHFEEGLAPFEKNDLLGFLNTSGKVAIEPRFMGVGYFNGGLAWARTMVDNKKKLGFIDKEGKWVVQPTFDAVDDFDPVSGIARVKKDDGWIYMKKDGSFVKPAEGTKLRDFKEGLAIAELNDMIGFLNPDGKWAIKPAFSDARHFRNGFAAVKQDGKWGIIDKKGNWVVKPTYDAIKDVEVIK